MFDTFKNRLELTGTLWTVTALRIGAGRSTEPIGSDLPVIKDAVGRPLIPGSSFKGALRSRLESFLRGILGSDRRLVANPANEDEWSLKANEIGTIKALNLEQLVTLHYARETEDFKTIPLDELVERIRKENLRIQDKNLLTKDELNELKKQHTNDSALAAVVIQHTDIISQLFGSPWIASKFQVRDLTVLPDAWFGQYQERDGVAIDRDTETAADGKLYDFQVVPAGTPFTFQAVVENAEPWELGLLTIGLHQFETKQIPLGGGRSRGLGVVRLEIDQMQWFDAEDNPERLLTYLQNLVKGEMESYLCYPERMAALREDWTEALINHLRQKVSSSTKIEVK